MSAHVALFLSGTIVSRYLFACSCMPPHLFSSHCFCLFLFLRVLLLFFWHPEHREGCGRVGAQRRSDGRRSAVRVWAELPGATRARQPSGLSSSETVQISKTTIGVFVLHLLPRLVYYLLLSAAAALLPPPPPNETRHPFHAMPPLSCSIASRSPHVFAPARPPGVVILVQNERGHPFQADFCLIDRLQHLKIKQIACGGEHSVAVAENGEVTKGGHVCYVFASKRESKRGVWSKKERLERRCVCERRERVSGRGTVKVREEVVS